MAYQLGLGSANVVQLGVQTNSTTPNTTSTIQLDCMSFSYDGAIGFITDPSITTASCEAAVLPAGRSFKGSFKARLNIGGMTVKALGAILGVVTGTGAAGTPYVIADATPAWWTIKCNRGGYNTTSGACELISGVVFEGMTLSCAAGSGDAGMATVDFTFSGSTLAVGGTLTSLSSDAAVPCYFAVIDAVTISNGVNTVGSLADWRPTSVSIEYKRPVMTPDMYLTSLSLDPPTPSGPATCEWKWEGRLTNADQITNVIGTMVPTQGLALKFINGTNKSMLLKSATTPANTSCSAYSTKVEGYGAVTESISWRCGHNASDAGAIKVTTIVSA